MWSSLPFFTVIRSHTDLMLIDENDKIICRLHKSDIFRIGEVYSLNDLEFSHKLYECRIDYFKLNKYSKKNIKIKFI